MNKVEIFKNYLLSLSENKEYEKVKQFKKFLHGFFARKGQKTEYVYCLGLGFTPIHKITDEMLDSIT